MIAVVPNPLMAHDRTGCAYPQVSAASSCLRPPMQNVIDTAKEVFLYALVVLALSILCAGFGAGLALLLR